MKLTYQAASRLGDRRGKLGTVTGEAIGNASPVRWDGENVPQLYHKDYLEPVYLQGEAA